jgi:hypothetical protein
MIKDKKIIGKAITPAGLDTSSGVKVINVILPSMRTFVDAGSEEGRTVRQIHGVPPCDGPLYMSVKSGSYAHFCLDINFQSRYNRRYFM